MQGNVAKVSQHQFIDDGSIPNSRLPVIVYREAIAPDEVTPEAIEQMFTANDWPPQWRSSVFTYHHYHSTAHEVLGVAQGTADITFGGPKGDTLTVTAGDVVVIPAGVGHKRESASADFLVVGAYPPGSDWDILTGEDGERPQADENIASVKVPLTDPVSGVSGPLIDAWA